jgi:hypothetical protein
MMLGTALAVAACSAAQGAILSSSQLNASGSAVFGAVSTTFQCNQPGDTGCLSAPAGTGDFVVAGSTASFSQYNGTFGLIKSFNNAAQPLNTPFSLPNAITLQLNSVATFDLTFIMLGTNPVSADCAGLTHCTPTNFLLITPNNPGGLSAYSLDQGGAGTTATLVVRGTMHDQGGPNQSFTGIFTIGFTGLNPQQALSSMNSGNPLTYNLQVGLAESTTPTPEPTTLLLTAIGALGLLLRRR